MIKSEKNNKIITFQWKYSRKTIWKKIKDNRKDKKSEINKIDDIFINSIYPQYG